MKDLQNEQENKSIILAVLCIEVRNRNTKLKQEEKLEGKREN